MITKINLKYFAAGLFVIPITSFFLWILLGDYDNKTAVIVSVLAVIFWTFVLYLIGYYKGIVPSFGKVVIFVLAGIFANTILVFAVHYLFSSFTLPFT